MYSKHTFLRTIIRFVWMNIIDKFILFNATLLAPFHPLSRHILNNCFCWNNGYCIFRTYAGSCFSWQWCRIFANFFRTYHQVLCHWRNAGHHKGRSGNCTAITHWGRLKKFIYIQCSILRKICCFPWGNQQLFFSRPSKV